MNAPNEGQSGTLEWHRGKARLRLSLGSFGRRMLTLTTCRTEAQAEESRAQRIGAEQRAVLRRRGR